MGLVMVKDIKGAGYSLVFQRVYELFGSMNGDL